MELRRQLSCSSSHVLTFAGVLNFKQVNHVNGNHVNICNCDISLDHVSGLVAVVDLTKDEV